MQELSSSASVSYRFDIARAMVRIRMVEETIASRYADAQMRCPVHLSIGQEAIAVGVCAALRADDRVFSSHRCHAHYLAKGGDLRAMIAELHGSDKGCCGGRGGSMHLFDLAVGMVASLPIVASALPLATGTALADKLDGNDRVTVVFFGEAACEEGAFHEAMNIAAVKQLPVIFVCEDNGLSIHTPKEKRQPKRNLVAFGAAHGIASVTIDGADLVLIERMAKAAAADARHGRPSFLVCETTRLSEHCGPAYDLIGAWDPLTAIRLSDDETRVIKAEIEDAFAFALAN